MIIITTQNQKHSVDPKHHDPQKLCGSLKDRQSNSPILANLKASVSYLCNLETNYLITQSSRFYICKW